MLKASIVPDTNVFISNLDMLRDLIKEKFPVLVTINISSIVIKELDTLKKMHTSARKAIRFIESHISDLNVEIEGKVDDRKIEVEYICEESIEEKNNDDKILNYALKLENPILLTNDIGFALKCQSFNILVIKVGKNKITAIVDEIMSFLNKRNKKIDLFGEYHKDNVNTDNIDNPYHSKDNRDDSSYNLDYSGNQIYSVNNCNNSDYNIYSTLYNTNGYNKITMENRDSIRPSNTEYNIIDNNGYNKITMENRDSIRPSNTEYNIIDNNGYNKITMENNDSIRPSNTEYNIINSEAKDYSEGNINGFNNADYNIIINKNYEKPCNTANIDYNCVSFSKDNLTYNKDNIDYNNKNKLEVSDANSNLCNRDYKTGYDKPNERPIIDATYKNKIYAGKEENVCKNRKTQYNGLSGDKTALNRKMKLPLISQLQINIMNYMNFTFSIVKRVKNIVIEIIFPIIKIIILNEVGQSQIDILENHIDLQTCLNYVNKNFDIFNLYLREGASSIIQDYIDALDSNKVTKIINDSKQLCMLFLEVRGKKKITEK